jgi:hypothetical protein
MLMLICTDPKEVTSENPAMSCKSVYCCGTLHVALIERGVMMYFSISEVAACVNYKQFYPGTIRI